MDRTRPATTIALGAALLVTGALTGCSSDTDGGLQAGDTAGDASCAAALEYDGEEYWGWGDLKRTPPVTGRVEPGTALGCDDGNGAVADRPVEVSELTDVAMDRAVLSDGTIYVRTGVRPPEQMRVWFQAPTCRGSAPLGLSGSWLGVHGTQEVRFDGDLRPPYQVEMLVVSGPPRYRGATIMVDVIETTAPALDQDDVRTALWEEGTLSAEVVCVGGTFVATALASSPRAPARAH